MALQPLRYLEDATAQQRAAQHRFLTCVTYTVSYIMFQKTGKLYVKTLGLLAATVFAAAIVAAATCRQTLFLAASCRIFGSGENIILIQYKDNRTKYQSVQDCSRLVV